MSASQAISSPAGAVYSAEVRRRGLTVLLIDIFLMWGGFFMVVPLISVHYVDGLGWAAASIGLALAVRQLLQQGSTPLSGILADRIGTKGLICAGLLVRSLGFALLARADTFSVLMLAMILTALGGGLFEAPTNATVAALTEPANRNRYFALLGVAGGLGMTIGTQIGALLLRTDFSLVALCAAGSFVANFVVTLIFLPGVHATPDGQSLTYGLRLAIHDRPFVLFTMLMMGYWFMWVQFTLALPLAAKSISNSVDSVVWVYTINALSSVVLQWPLIRLAGRWLRPMPATILGLVLMALALMAVPLTANLAGLLACVLILSIGSLIAQPNMQTITAALANPTSLGSYFGFSALAVAVGGGLGNYSGGLLYDLGKQLAAPALPWLIFGGVGLAAAVGMTLMDRQRPKSAAMQSEAPGQSVPGVVTGD